MNVRDSAARLPESLRKIVAAQPSVAARLRGGMPLHEVLSSPEWAAEWVRDADPLHLSVLSRLLRRFGSHAFEEEKGEAEIRRGGQVTGAEWRAAAARLRSCGILYAVRKTWGERLYYIPADMIPVWQRILLPTHATPLRTDESGRVELLPGPQRLPLPLEMLGVWSSIRRSGAALTAKGAVSKPAAARLSAETRLTPEELAPLRLVYPQQDALSPGAALALDLGLCTGVLRKREKAVSVSPDGLPAWMTGSLRTVNAEFWRLVVLRYASADPRMHLAASAMASCVAETWYREQDIAAIGIGLDAVEAWLQVLEAFGWAQRGRLQQNGCFRLSADLGGLAGGTGLEPEEETESFFIQPDGEIMVPPHVGLADRWFLEEISERITADRLFIYRLTRKSCARACESGIQEQEVRRFLEQGSGAPLPETVSEALTDWFRFLGRTRIEADAVLLRTDGGETAGRLLEDAETADCLLERIGERDFIVDREKLKRLRKRLEHLGYAPLACHSDHTGSDPTDENAAAGAEQEWICASHLKLSIFRPDPSALTREELFPGQSEIPAAWLTRPGTYHASTRRELIQQAIGWRAAVQIGEEGSAAVFVPHSLSGRGEHWEVRGRWKPAESAAAFARSEGGPEPELVTLRAEEVSPLKIVLPAIDTSF